MLLNITLLYNLHMNSILLFIGKYLPTLSIFVLIISFLLPNKPERFSFKRICTWLITSIFSSYIFIYAPHHLYCWNSDISEENKYLFNIEKIQFFIFIFVWILSLGSRKERLVSIAVAYITLVVVNAFLPVGIGLKGCTPP